MRPQDSAEFVGLYNVTITLKNGQRKVHKRVFVDNEQRKHRNYRLTDEKGEATLYMKSDIDRVDIDSKDCQR